MSYSEMSFDHSKSMNPPPEPAPVYHFQHIAARDEDNRKKRLQKLAEDAARGARISGTLGVRFGL